MVKRDPDRDDPRIFIEYALSQAKLEFARHLKEVNWDWHGGFGGIEPADVTMAAAILSADAGTKIERHSKNLARLTRVLIGLSAVLSALTAVLVWRTFV